MWDDSAYAEHENVIREHLSQAMDLRYKKGLRNHQLHYEDEVKNRTKLKACAKFKLLFLALWQVIDSSKVLYQVCARTLTGCRRPVGCSI